MGKSITSGINHLVSMTNDDHLDNRFKTAAGRIPEVEEDEEIEHLMFADYDKVRK